MNKYALGAAALVLTGGIAYGYAAITGTFDDTADRADAVDGHVDGHSPIYATMTATGHSAMITSTRDQWAAALDPTWHTGRGIEQIPPCWHDQPPSLCERPINSQDRLQSGDVLYVWCPGAGSHTLEIRGHREVIQCT